MKVRATQDGVYAGYYRTGPIGIGTPEYVQGEVFEIQDGLVAVLNTETGLPEPERNSAGEIIYVMDGNKHKLDKDGQRIPKVRMKSHFSKTWMEQVADDSEITNDYPKFELPIQYRKPKAKPAQPVEAVTLKQLHAMEQVI